MKTIIPAEPFILCKKLDHQLEVKKLVIPGQEDKTSCLKRVVKVSNAAKNRNIQQGDIVLTRAPQYLLVPTHLTANDEVPYNTGQEEAVEIVDPSQVIAVYREENNEGNSTN